MTSVKQLSVPRDPLPSDCQNDRLLSVQLSLVSHVLNISSLTETAAYMELLLPYSCVRLFDAATFRASLTKYMEGLPSGMYYVLFVNLAPGITAALPQRGDGIASHITNCQPRSKSVPFSMYHLILNFATLGSNIRSKS